ncbi:MAG TPA: histidinol-phosphate transaminase [Actinomycetota bacterium]|nr:histidinol-phosphate transaminase [Actinomycetota bacterium]
MTPAIEPRPGLRDVEPYVSPQLDVTARLNTNECPLPLPEGFSTDLAAAVRELPLHRYPDGLMTRLREELAAGHGHPVEGTWTANGSNEVLTQLLLAYGGPGRTAVVFEPTYLLHARLSWLTHTGLVQVRLDAPYVLDHDAIDEGLRAGPDVVFVCSPNNPTGNAQPLEAIASLAERTTALVIVDEAYIEFGGESALKLVADHGNVAVVRTFSKAFAMAGARLGYALTSPEVVGDLQRVRLPYHVSALTQTAGIVALRHMSEAMSLLDSIRSQRDRISRELGAIPGMTVFPSDANFVLFVPPPPHDARQVWQALVDRGVLVRDLTAVVPNGLRVTAGAEHEVDLFLASLREVLSA